MKIYGLIGQSLGHSFSREYFTNKFKELGLPDHRYENFELENIAQLPNLIKSEPQLLGLNVTIPYKRDVMPLLDNLSPQAKAIGAVNTIKIDNEKLDGYNTDCFGFEAALRELLGSRKITKALILGTGGSAQTVQYVLHSLSVETNSVSSSGSGDLNYEELRSTQLIRESELIVNTTPLGMYPKTSAAPDIDFEQISSDHILFDLIYNPGKTAFLAKAEERGARTSNGLKMLHLQAEKSWEIWNT